MSSVRAVPVVKMSGAGNDFLMIDNREKLLKESELAALAKAACPRAISAGADGVVLVEPPTKPGHDYRMRIFNADGSEAEMCGNGSRCIAVFARNIGAARDTQRMETLAGTVQASVPADGLSASVQLSQPSKLELKKAVDVLGKPVDLYVMNTGVPHAVQFVSDVSAVDVKKAGACIRYHEVFKPRGANANFVQLMGNNTIKIRTYERGVEDETGACGTGATAASIIAGLIHGYSSPVKVFVASGVQMQIHFEKTGNDAVARPFLEGPVDTIYKGEFYWRT